MEWHITKQTVAWFKSGAAEGTLSLAAPYQRRPVWNLKQRCWLIESILLKCPVPEIFAQVTTAANGAERYIVVDGQQRIRSILKFLGEDEDDIEDNGFALTRLPENSTWHGFCFEDLSNEQKQAFFGYTLSVRVLKTEDEADVRDMFRRLNKFVSPLTGQEVRNAIYTGPFIDLSNRLADDDYFATERIVTPATIRRMGDIEFVSELLLGVMYGPQDGSVNAIDQHYERLEGSDDEIPDQTRTVVCYNATLDRIKFVLPDIRDTRWSNRHDFYTLFVAIAHYLREGYRFAGSKAKFRAVLDRLAHHVQRSIADEHASVPGYAERYARAIQKGPNSKARRGARHQEMLRRIKPFFKKGK